MPKYQLSVERSDCGLVRLVCAAVIIVLLVAIPAVAEIGPIEIVAPAISSQNSFEIGDTPVGEFTGFRQLIQKEELQQAGASLAEVVAVESGVQFRQSGGQGSFSSVSLRGSSAEQVNVYVDGVLLNEAAGGAVNFSDIELMQAEKVEVFRGNIPVQLGNSAIGGAINITTARASAQPVGSLLAGFGSFGSKRFSAAYSGPAGSLSEQRLVASISHRQSDNDFSFVNDNATTFNTDDDRIQRRHNARTRTTSGFVKTGYQLTNGGRLEHVLQAYDRHQGLPDWRNTSSGSAKLDTDSIQYRAVYRKSVTPSVETDNQWSSLLGVNFGRKSELFDDRASSIGTGRQLVDTDTQVIGGRAYWERVTENASLSMSLNGRHEMLDSINKFSQAGSTAATRTQVDLSVQWNRNFHNASLFSVSLFGGIVDDDYRISDGANRRRDFNTSSLLPQLGISHALNDQWSVVANASRHKRVPSFFELFGSQGLFEGNSSLRTESANNVDIGFIWQSSADKRIDLWVEMAVFHSHRENLISRVYNSRGIGQSENLARARVAGLEFGQKATFENGFFVNSSATFQDAINHSDISGFTGKQLPGEASVDAALTLGWKNSRWRLKYEYRLNTDRFYDSANLLQAADQQVHSISLGRHWKDWRLDIELNNLSDQNHEDFNGYPKPGRAGFLRLFYQPKSESKR